MFRRLRRILLIFLASLLGLVLIVFLVGTGLLRGSRPRLEGELELEGLSGPVTVTRDALGVPACDVREWSFDGLTYDEVRTENREPPRQDIAGSNGQVAWGFTNSYGDWADLVIIEADPEDPARYRTPDGWKKMKREAEIIIVAGASPDTLWVEETIWGPVWTTDTKGRRLALRWTAHDTEAVNLNLRHLETATDVDAARTWQ
jgi:acyl-homoserine lactone acylase PvdQ